VAEAAPVAHVALEQVYARPPCERPLETPVLRVVGLLVDVDIDDAGLGGQAFDEAGYLVEVLVGQRRCTRARRAQTARITLEVRRSRAVSSHQ
jgi:hypothetical protein